MLVHAGQLSAYPETNITGKHKGFQTVSSLICDRCLILDLEMLSVPRTNGSYDGMHGTLRDDRRNPRKGGVH